jgi:hypothetical protein
MDRREGLKAVVDVPPGRNSEDLIEKWKLRTPAEAPVRENGLI